MSACGFNTITNATTNAAKNVLSPQFGQGIYCGIYYPGSTTPVPSFVGSPQPAVGAEVIIQNDQNFISSLVQQPQNVLRLTGQGGVSYIQGSNIAFGLPYSANVNIRILPSTNQINVQNLAFVSTISPLAAGGVGLAGTINMTQLTSTIQGYGWADVV